MEDDHKNAMVQIVNYVQTQISQLLNGYGIEELSAEHAYAMATSKWWESNLLYPYEVALFQLHQPFLCMDKDDFVDIVGVAVGGAVLARALFHDEHGNMFRIALIEKITERIQQRVIQPRSAPEDYTSIVVP